VQETTVRHLLTIATTLLVLAGAGLLVNAFYPLAALLGVVLILTYILLGPVNLMEKGLLVLFRLRAPRPGKAVQQAASLQTAPRQGDMDARLPERPRPRTPETTRFRRAAGIHPRALAVLLVYLVFFVSLTLGGAAYLPLLGRQLGELSRRLGSQTVDFSNRVIDWAEHSAARGAIRTLFAREIQEAERQGLLHPHVPGRPVASASTPPQSTLSEAPRDGSVTPEEKEVIQHSVIQSTITQLENALTAALPNFVSLMGGTFNGLLYGLAGALLMFYLLSDGRRVREDVLALFPPAARHTADYLLKSFHQVMFAFIKGQVMLGVLTGVYMGTVYSLFHVPYAILLGVLFAVAELLPIVGTWIGIGIGLMVILFNMEPIVALWVWLCSYAYQTVKDNILAPKVVGDVMGLHPLVIVLALVIGAQAAGLLGVLMALPMASAVNVVIRLLLHKDEQEKALPGTPPDSPQAPTGPAHA
jgi:predicted PurR-regulated permease PerM